MKKLKLLTNIEESYHELRVNTSWPTKKQVVKSALIVMLASVIIAAIIFCIDWVFKVITEFIYDIPTK